ncbi:MAG: hypothetical protein JJU20_00390 [Opitutales bacterium]|nr:hypothetical protein [Opitutales bacterium]
MKSSAKRFKLSGFLVCAVFIVAADLYGGKPYHERELSDPLWPAFPQMVSPGEGIIEAFWAPNALAQNRWEIVESEGVEQARFERFWDRVELQWTATEAGKVRMQRPYELFVGDFSEAVLRVMQPEGTRLSYGLSFEEGEVYQSSEVVLDRTPRESRPHIEHAMPIKGKQLNQAWIDVTVDEPGDYVLTLRWLMLRRPDVGLVVDHPDYERYIQRPDNPDYLPGLGLILSGEDIKALRKMVAAEPYADLLQKDLTRFGEWLGLDFDPQPPAYFTYSNSRYGRLANEAFKSNRADNGLLEGLLGQLKKDPELMERAAHKLIRLAAIPDWEEGFTVNNSFVDWHHSGFSYNFVTLFSALLLDWCWDWLTPDGRQFVAEAIRVKGLEPLERFRFQYANQGTRFHKGLLLGKLALSKGGLGAPLSHTQVLAEIDSLNKGFLPQMNEDGTFIEGVSYGAGTAISTLLTYYAAARATGVDIRDLVPERLIRSAHFNVAYTGEMLPMWAAFLAGPMKEDSFSAYYYPTPLFDHAETINLPETWFFGLHWIWMDGKAYADAYRQKEGVPDDELFQFFPDGGWIISRSDLPDRGFNLKVESGFWRQGGHTYPTKGQFELSWGEENFFLTKEPTGYGDSQQIQSRDYNLFTPSGRNQDALLKEGRGAETLLARSVNGIDFIEMDFASAWLEGVQKGIRRMVYIRPNIILIDDQFQLSQQAGGIQHWNSRYPFQKLAEGSFKSTGESAAIKVSVLSAGESYETEYRRSDRDHIDRIRNEYRQLISSLAPVYELDVQTPESLEHRIQTLITGQGDKERMPEIRQVDQGIVELKGNDGRRVFILLNGKDSAGKFGLQTDGNLALVIHREGRPESAYAFNASYLSLGDRRVEAGIDPEFLYLDIQSRE